MATPQKVSSSPVSKPNKVEQFEILSRNEDKLVGDHEFLAMSGTRSSFWFDVKGADGYNIPACTITGVLTFVDTGKKEPLLSAVNCPSRSVYTATQGALKPGRYKLVATAFVPDTGEKAQTEYDFTVVPTG